MMYNTFLSCTKLTGLWQSACPSRRPSPHHCGLGSHRFVAVEQQSGDSHRRRPASASRFRSSPGRGPDRASGSAGPDPLATTHSVRSAQCREPDHSTSRQPSSVSAYPAGSCRSVRRSMFPPRPVRHPAWPIGQRAALQKLGNGVDYNEEVQHHGVLSEVDNYFEENS
jgi:hypothetical protein